MIPIDAYIALGSNLDNPRAHILQAFEDLKTLPQTELIKHSTLIKTKPVGILDQPDFINAAAWIKTHLDPFILLEHLQKIEQQHQRKKTKPWGPRTLDLDILLYGDKKINTNTLTIPHPHMHERDFVLIPLKEIMLSPEGKFFG